MKEYPHKLSQFNLTYHLPTPEIKVEPVKQKNQMNFWACPSPKVIDKVYDME
jgi:hypothetical protein